MGGEGSVADSGQTVYKDACQEMETGRLLFTNVLASQARHKATWMTKEPESSTNRGAAGEGGGGSVKRVQKRTE